jgi:hypothetical protein
MTFSVLLPPVQTDLMFKPGAKMSTHLPKLLLYGIAANIELAEGTEIIHSSPVPT